MAKVKTLKSYIDSHLNPPTLNKDVDGDYIFSQLEGIIRTYNASLSYLDSMKGKHKEVSEIIARKETSTRGNYLRLLNKPDKSDEENELLYKAITDIEELYMVLPALERRIREAERKLQAVYPPSFMVLVFNEYENLKGDI